MSYIAAVEKAQEECARCKEERDRFRRERDEARHEWAWAIEDNCNRGDHGSYEDYVVHILCRRFGIDENEARSVARMEVPTKEIDL